jgi:hypothetical protein
VRWSRLVLLIVVVAIGAYVALNWSALVPPVVAALAALG